MSKESWLLLITALKVGILLLLASCSTDAPKELPPQKVQVVEIVERSLTKKVDFIGQVHGYQDIAIRARVPGYLEGIHFNEGLPVEKGQLLYTIDSQPFDAEVAAQQSRLAEAKSVYAKAKNDLNRYKPLAESNAVSQSDLDAAQTQYEAAEASVKAAEANLEIAEIQRSYTRIHSPIDGIIGKSMAQIGELVGQMPSTMLNTVSKMDEIFVEFFLPERLYLQIVREIDDTDRLYEERDTVTENLELLLADGTIHDYKGSVNFIDRGVDRSTGTILIQTRFKNPKRLIRPGQYAKVLIPVSFENAIVVPQRCVKELQGQFSVFIVNAENKIETRQITTTTNIGDLIVIESGLNPGEKVVFEGIQKVSKGLLVAPSLVDFTSQVESR